jgi:hypothetical protein
MTSSKSEPDLTLAGKDCALPRAPASLEETGLGFAFLVELLSKVLFVSGQMRLADISQHVKLPGSIVEAVLGFARAERICEIARRGEGPGDVHYKLTDSGRERAGEFLQKCHYTGPAPVTITAYTEQVRRQSVSAIQVKASDIERAFAGMVVPSHVKDELGAAMNCGRGLFVYGPAGGGKTYLTKRLQHLLDGRVAVPYAICVDHQVIQFFDPLIHQTCDVPVGDAGLDTQRRADARWRLCGRPVALSGGELTLDMLNLYFDPSSHLHHAPSHLKANNGLYIIDDLGRQAVSPQQLMGRWIVPMDQHVDYQALHNGYKFAVPFDVILVFSTNMSPADLADPAFLRRLGYKVHVGALNESDYRALFRNECVEQGLEYSEEAFEYLVREHHKRDGTPLLACYPRDLLAQIRARALYQNAPPELTCASLERAWRSYFASN